MAYYKVFSEADIETGFVKELSIAANNLPVQFVTPFSTLYKPHVRTPGSQNPYRIAHFGFEQDNGDLVSSIFDVIGKEIVGVNIMHTSDGIGDVARASNRLKKLN